MINAIQIKMFWMHPRHQRMFQCKVCEELESQLKANAAQLWCWTLLQKPADLGMDPFGRLLDDSYLTNKMVDNVNTVKDLWIANTLLSFKHPASSCLLQPYRSTTSTWSIMKQPLKQPIEETNWNWSIEAFHFQLKHTPKRWQPVCQWGYIFHVCQHFSSC